MNPKKIGTYTIPEDGIIKETETSIIYRGYRENVPRDVAIKILKNKLMGNLKHEINIIAALEHPNIIPIYEFNMDVGPSYYIMKFMKGGSLEEKLNNEGVILEDETVRIIELIAPALDSLHEEKIIHGDVKPGNILFDGNNNPYIADFGISRYFESVSGEKEEFKYLTPAYMSPEQVMRKIDIDWRSDIYSLGVMIFHLLTGQIPFTAESPSDMALKHLYEPIPKLIDFNNRIRGDYQMIIEKAMAKNKEERYKSAKEIAKDMRVIFEEKTREIKPKLRPTKISKGLLAIVSFVLLLFLIWNIPSQKPYGQSVSEPIMSKDVTESISVLIDIPTPPEKVVVTETPIIDSSAEVSQIPEDMVLVPAGEFQMGSDSGENDERPVHTVYLDAYYIDIYEVTNTQFTKFLNTNGNQEEGGVAWMEATDPDVKIFLNEGSWWIEKGFETSPVIEVSWYGAQAFCKWRDGSLPTEAQWEKAALGGTEMQSYPWGNELPDCKRSNYGGTKGCFGRITQVGSFPPNNYGLFDLAGNVWEWVMDWYEEDYYSISPINNPEGPHLGNSRVMRGGSWYNKAEILRVSNRGWNAPKIRDHLIGFRCVRPRQ